MASRDNYSGLAEVEPLWSPLGHLGPRPVVGGQMELAAAAFDLAAVDVEPPGRSSEGSGVPLAPSGFLGVGSEQVGNLARATGYVVVSHRVSPLV
jgi:hypothetical protein